MKMGADIMGLGRRSVVHIAADVAVPVLGFNLAHRHEAGIAVHRLLLAIDVDDFADVLGAEEVLRLALAVFAVGIDEENLFPVGSALLVHHENAGRNAGAVEQPGDNVWTRCERIEPDFVQNGNMEVVVLGKGYAEDTTQESSPYTFAPDTLKVDMREQYREMRMRFRSNTQY
jgi:hypothetical protein